MRRSSRSTPNQGGDGTALQGRVGLPSVVCFADATGEALAGMLRPGNAGANTVADHVVLDAAVASCRRRSPWDTAPVTTHHSCSNALSWWHRLGGLHARFRGAARARNVGFFVVARSNTQVHSAIFDPVGSKSLGTRPAPRRQPPRGGGGSRTHRVVELTEWPKGTRLIVSGPLHPGAQHSLFPSLSTATGGAPAIRTATR